MTTAAAAAVTKATIPPALVQQTKARIASALTRTDATGMKGFLLWVEAAWPKEISGPIIKAAQKALNKANVAAGVGVAQPLGLYSRPVPIVWGGPNTFGRLGALGQTGASTTAATPSTSATPSWMSEITSAISAVGQAYLTKQQVSDAQTIFNTNLQRAQMGLSPLPTNPANYGLPVPGVSVGLSYQTQNLLMWGAIGAGVLGVAYLAIKATKG